ncbi:MAG TPA: hypothetical protein VNE40_02170 [Candidatus Dormibacteraeota bacterium]|nr:hypothetical protein [Candidatus Dormibacteraeota bacterium]
MIKYQLTGLKKKLAKSFHYSSSFEIYFLIFLASLIPISIFLNRFLIPDFSFDTFFYHLFNGVRGTHNYLWSFSPNEFYPLGFGTIAPVYDSIIYLFRVLLGYRLGTIIDLISYIGIIWITYRLIIRVVNFKIKVLSPILRLIFFLNAVIVTELLFQLATQYVDVINAFFILLAIYSMAVFLDTRKNINLWLAAAIFGIALLAKATNIIYALPFYIIVAVDVFGSKHKSLQYKIVILVLVGAITAIPTLIYGYINFRLTSNPIFPMYNEIFHSPYSAPISFSAKQSGAGGQTLLQIIFWPIVSFWHASRLAEPHSVFNDWKLGIYWVISIIMFIPLIWKKLDKSEKSLIIFFVLSTEIWGFLLGIMRYATVDIILGGIILLVFFIRISMIIGKKSLMLAVPLILVLVFDNYRIINFNLTYDMSWRPNLIHNTKLYLAQRSNLFYNYLKYPQGVNNKINNSQIFLDCVHQSPGLIALSGYTNKPVLNIESEAPSEAITGEIKYREVAVRKIFDIYHHYNLTFTTFAITNGLDVEYQACIQNLSVMGGSITHIIPLNSFLGYANEKPVVIIGKINLTSYIHSPPYIQP